MQLILIENGLDISLIRLANVITGSIKVVLTERQLKTDNQRWLTL